MSIIRILIFMGLRTHGATTDRGDAATLLPAPIQMLSQGVSIIVGLPER